jgi:hypothetical protein
MLQLPPPGTKLRHYDIYLLVDNPLDESSCEFIGWFVDYQDESERDVSHALYRDVEGLLHYFVGNTVEDTSDFEVLSVCISADYWVCGKSREEIVTKIREEFGTEAVHIPTFLRSPPEIETMHEITGYDS